MLVQPTQVMVFDSEQVAQELRLVRAKAALSRLKLKPKLIRATGDRRECLEWLTQLAEDETTLLLCDMVDDADLETVGNVGARLLRTIARHPDLATATWRVMWSQQRDLVVASEISAFAHAYVWFEFGEGASAVLAQALEHVLQGPPADGHTGERASFAVFGNRGLDDDQMAQAWKDAISRLLLPGQPYKINDELAARAIIENPGDILVNPLLEAAREAAPKSERRGYCEKVDDLIKRLGGDRAEARRALREALMPVLQRSISSQLTYRKVERAGRLMDQHLRAKVSARLTYLSAGEEDLARTLVDVYRRHLGSGVRGDAMEPRREALDAAVADPEVEEAYGHADLAAFTSTREARADLLAYVIGTYNDTARSLDRERYQAAASADEAVYSSG